MKGNRVVRSLKPGTQNLYCIYRNGIHKSALFIAPKFIYKPSQKYI